MAVAVGAVALVLEQSRYLLAPRMSCGTKLSFKHRYSSSCSSSISYSFPALIIYPGMPSSPGDFPVER